MKDSKQELSMTLDRGHLGAGGALVKATWEQIEGSPLPLGACWIHEEQAFNFAVYARGMGMLEALTGWVMPWRLP